MLSPDMERKGKVRTDEQLGKAGGMSCIAGLCCDALGAVQNQSCCHEPGECSPRKKGVGAWLVPSPKELQGRGVARLVIKECMDRLFPWLNFSASKWLLKQGLCSLSLIGIGKVDYCPLTWTSRVMDKHFCPLPYGPLGHCGSRSSVVQHRKGWQGRSSPGCKSALFLPGRTMPAQFTPTEDLIGIWLWLQNWDCFIIVLLILYHGNQWGIWLQAPIWILSPAWGH